VGLGEQLGGLGSIALVWSLAFAAHAVRYLGASAAVQVAIGCLPALRRRRLRVAANAPSRELRALELWSSVEAGAVFALVASGVTLAFRSGHTQLYLDAGRHGFWYEPFSFIALLILHDTYFYWTHRLLHHPKVFARVHAHHHRSQYPTAWSTYSFDPLESVVQAGIYALVPFALPVHFTVLGLFVLTVNVHAALIHSGHDLFLVRGRSGRRLHGRVLSTSLDHDLHHGGARGNYGLYFSFWDRVMKTQVES
jgi:Delta7-sterol 5-desaturase